MYSPGHQRNNMLFYWGKIRNNPLLFKARAVRAESFFNKNPIFLNGYALLGGITLTGKWWQWGVLCIFLKGGGGKGWGEGDRARLENILRLHLPADAGAVGGADPDGCRSVYCGEVVGDDCCGNLADGWIYQRRFGGKGAAPIVS